MCLDGSFHSVSACCLNALHVLLELTYFSSRMHHMLVAYYQVCRAILLHLQLHWRCIMEGATQNQLANLSHSRPTARVFDIKAKLCLLFLSKLYDYSIASALK